MIIFQRQVTHFPLTDKAQFQGIAMTQLELFDDEHRPVNADELEAFFREMEKILSDQPEEDS